MWRYFLPTRVTDRPARQLDQLDTLYAHIFNFARWYRGTCTFSSKRRPRVDVIYGDYLRKVHIYDVHVHVGDGERMAGEFLYKLPYNCPAAPTQALDFQHPPCPSSRNGGRWPLTAGGDSPLQRHRCTRCRGR